MNIIHLKYAVEIARAGSINKAAEVLLMGQPNLSRAIKELEGSLGITIFDRSSKGMVVTPEGEEFLGFAKKIIEQIDTVEDYYRRDLPIKHRFSISVPRACYISDAFAKFSLSLDKLDHAEVFYKETNALRAIKNITEADYKLGIIRYSESFDKYFKSMLDEKGFSYEIIADFSYVLIMNEKSPLASLDTIRYDDLKPYLEIAHADPYVPSLPLAVVKKEELPDNTNKKIFVFERASQFDLLCENKDTFMWVSPVPDKVLSRYNLVQKSCPDNKKIYRDVLVYKKDYKFSELDNRFITELCNSKRQYLTKK